MVPRSYLMLLDHGELYGLGTTLHSAHTDSPGQRQCLAAAAASMHGLVTCLSFVLQKGHYFIDRDSRHFHDVLNFLRVFCEA